MSKRLVFKLAVMVAALSAVTLLPGCGENENGVAIGWAWMPCIPGVTFGTAGFATTTTGTTQGGGGGAAGATAGAGAGAAGGGGGQVSTGVAQ